MNTSLIEFKLPCHLLFVQKNAFINFVLAGVIDEDYRGNVGILLFNHSDEDFNVSPGDRVAQLICEKIAYPEIIEYKVCIFTFLIILLLLVIFIFKFSYFRIWMKPLEVKEVLDLLVLTKVFVSCIY